MNNTLLFSFIKEYTKSAVGKVWHIKILSGKLGLDDKVKFHVIRVSGSTYIKEYITAIVKEIKKENSLGEYDFVDNATSGDIVTINLRDCYLDDRRIDKKDINITNMSLGTSYDINCKYKNELDVYYDCYDEFIEQLENSRRCELSVMWFGKMIPSNLQSINVDGDKFIIGLKLMDKRIVPLPQDKSIIRYFEKIIVKKSQSIENAAKWSYNVCYFKEEGDTLK